MQQLRQGRDLGDRGEPHPGEAFGSSAVSHPGGLMSFYQYVRLSFPKTWVLGGLAGPKGCAPGPAAFLAKGFKDLVQLSVLGGGARVEAPRSEV